VPKQYRQGVFRALFAAVLTTVAGLSSFAATLDVLIIDPEGAPVPDVAVYLSVGGEPQNTPGTAVMDQVDTRFVPHILLIQKGTSVEFPNSDVVAHHVYSFSKPNDFVLPLYKGDTHDPVIFEYDGVVTLGCNIHDHMLGYIVVVDTDVFGMTDKHGKVTLDVSGVAGTYSISAWNPRIRDRDSALTRQLLRTDTSIVFELNKKLTPPYDPGSEAVQWSEY
jgi:plastocyanin